MDGMRFVVTVAQPIGEAVPVYAQVPVPCDCQLVGIMVSGMGGTDSLSVGYIPPDGDETYTDEGICYGPLRLNSNRYWNYDEFQGLLHDGKSPFRAEMGSRIQVSSGDSTTRNKFVGLVFVEG